MTDLRKAAQQALNALLSASTYDERQAAITALRAALAQPDVLEGYVLVPVEPTEEMASRGAWAIVDGIDNRPETSWDEEAPMVYRAMLAAAPKGGA